MRRRLACLCLLALPFTAPAAGQALRPADLILPLVLASEPSVRSDQDQEALLLFRLANLAHELGDEHSAERLAIAATDCYGRNRFALPGRYLNALRAYPDNVAIRNAAAWVLLLSSKENARAALALMAPIPPTKHTPATLDTLAIAQLRCGQKVEALQTYLRILDRLSEDNPALCAYYAHFGDILYANGQCREALIAWLCAGLLFQAYLDAGFDPSPLLIEYDPAETHAKVRALRLLRPDL